jgi:hypothetical protein
MDHIGRGSLLADFAVNFQAERRILRVAVKFAAGIKPEIGQELSKPLAFPTAARLFHFALQIAQGRSSATP